jgi:hypothetical protein
MAEPQPRFDPEVKALDRYVNRNEDFVLVVLVFMRLLIRQHRRVDPAP